MSVLDRLAAAPAIYWGEGEGRMGGRFVARVALIRHPDASVTFDYEAWSAAGGLQHAESARIARIGGTVTLAATSSGGDDTLLFREGDPGVFGSTGGPRVGLVITPDDTSLTLSWWWADDEGRLQEQSRAVVSPMRSIVLPPPVQPVEPALTATGVVEPSDQEGAPPTVPWPGILVLHGSGTGLVAQRLAARLTRAAVVRTDLFDRAVRGTAGRPDPALRRRIAVSVVQGYAASGHPVILHGSSTLQEHQDLVEAIAGAGLSPVQLVEVAEGEDYGDVARRLIDDDEPVGAAPR